MIVRAPSMMPLRSAFAVLLVILSLGVSHAAYAACASPAGVAGEMIYNTDNSIMQYCDGTNWIGMSGSTPVSTLSGLSDVNTAGVANGNALIYNTATSKWIPGTVGGTAADTTGAVQFNGGSSAFAGDATKLFWDNTAKRLGIGIAVPTQALDVVGKATASGLIYKSVTGAAAPTAGSALWTTDGTNVWRPTGVVSVNTSSSNGQLTVAGVNAGTTPVLQLYSQQTGSTRMQINNTTPGSTYWDIGVNGSSPSSGTVGDWFFDAGGARRLTLTMAGALTVPSYMSAQKFILNDTSQMSLQYYTSANSNIPANTWHFRQGASNSNISIGQYENMPVFFYNNANANIGIGMTATSTVAKMEVAGITTAGDQSSSPTGSTGFGIRYSNGADLPDTIGSYYSSSALVLGYAVKPKSGSAGLVSSAGNAAWAKGALIVGDTLTFTNALGATVAIGTTVTTTDRFSVDNTGNLTISGSNAQKATGTTWSNPSDARLKNIDGPYEQGLDSVVKLNTVRFHFKPGNPRGLPTDKEIVGLIAQDVQKVFPEAVRMEKDGFLTLDTSPILFAYINAIKDLNAKNEALESKVDALTKRLDALEAKQ